MEKCYRLDCNLQCWANTRKRRQGHLTERTAKEAKQLVRVSKDSEDAAKREAA